jgi:hypothetical protein
MPRTGRVCERSNARSRATIDVHLAISCRSVIEVYSYTVGLAFADRCPIERGAHRNKVALTLV